LQQRTTGSWMLLAGACALGWAAVLSPGGSLAQSTLCSPWAAASLSGGWSALWLGLALNGPGHLAISWAAMVLAMTPPLLLTLPTAIGRRRREGPAAIGTGLFAVAYGGVWLAAGTVFIPAALWLGGVLATGASALAALLVVGLSWRLSPLHRHGVALCRRTAEVGARPGLQGALRMGVRHGLACVLTCWPLMLLPMVVHGGHQAAMLAASALQIADRAWSARTPGSRLLVRQRRAAGGRHLAFSAFAPAPHLAPPDPAAPS
jgi:predicted metal-binding membrane protein